MQMPAAERYGFCWVLTNARSNRLLDQSGVSLQQCCPIRSDPPRSLPSSIARYRIAFVFQTDQNRATVRFLFIPALWRSLPAKRHCPTNPYFDKQTLMIVLEEPVARNCCCRLPTLR